MQRERLLLEEIITAANRATQIASQYTAETLATYLDARDALLWNLTVLGEAVNQLPEDLRNSYPAIPWQHPTRLRNRIVHGYWSVDLDVLYAVAVSDLPTFVKAVGQVLKSL
ncbi:MAG: DUF86 domain-containing protein [Candidatus Nanopelagicales bacterium]|nr:DUF86 domain-containing protein [Candidatus Nanopelagicales bacterium]